MAHVHGCAGGGCSCLARPAPLQQSMDEMDWDRGIWCSAVDGHLGEVRRFVDGTAGKSWVNRPDMSGYTALHYAASNNHLAIVRYLLANGADVDPATRSGRTPLHKAACKGLVEVVEVLVGGGADPRRRDEDGKTPVDDAREGPTREYLVRCVS